MAASNAEENLVERIDRGLHGLCQPLTVLQCRLALGEMSSEPLAMRDAIGAALAECARLNAAVQSMRDLLLQTIRIEES
ncbi:hypothetical protein [Edaphobacter bradus]|uniref:hypothetical protein n=1 Tax=Edaphobacter bradus TaxID=2259016 RepID=UPI0021DFE25D|nr:hypothetical protein [Edaphobacter bradus]